jgi:hypothetical protein
MSAGGGLSGTDSVLDTAVLREHFFNGSSSSLRINHVLVASGNGGGNILDGIVLGNNVSGSFYWGGDLAEVIAFSGALTAADRRYLAQYANQRYGLAIPFPQTAAPTPSTNTSSTLINVNLLATSKDDLQIIHVAHEFSGVPINIPSGWSQLAAQGSRVGDQVRAAYFFRIAPADSGATTQAVTCSFPADWSAHAYNVSMWGGSLAEIAFSAVATGTGVSPNATSVTLPLYPGRDRHLVLALAAAGDDGVSFTGFPSGYSGGASTANGVSVGSARKGVAAGSEDPGAFTLASSEDWVARAVGIPQIASVPLRRGSGIMAGGL